MADCGRCPVARDKDGGAEAGEGNAGKLKGGFGGGARGCRGDGGPWKSSSVGDRLAAFVPMAIGEEPTGPSEMQVVAMIAAAAPRLL